MLDINFYSLIYMVSLRKTDGRNVWSILR